MSRSDGEELSERLERIRQLTADFLAAQSDSAAARALAERIRREIDAARVRLRPLEPPPD